MRIIFVKFAYSGTSLYEKLCTLAKKLGYDVAGIISMDLEEKLTSLKGYPVLPLREIDHLSWEAAILVCDKNIFYEFVPRMIELKIGTTEQFKDVFWLLKQFMIKKYEDFDDPAIQTTLEYWKTHEISVFNQHIPTDRGTLDRVFFDSECDLPYIYFKTISGKYRRMYFPRDKDFISYNGEKFLKNLMEEQVPTSPHLYIKDEHKVCEGDVVIDAGVAEGNFALRYVDICSKMYLFEPENKWIDPLKQTFKNYRDKVEIIPKFLSDVTGDRNITLDDALPNSLIGRRCFLKMDIEGSEPNALRGAEKFLTNNFVRASICSYHNPDDLIEIKSVFQKYGYRTSTSDGFMVFLYNSKIWDSADFRKGIVYAENF